ncbi:ABC transporter ATP-binding protein [Microbacterium sp. B2969]|uniref:ABC transporter ATP-binding protein n=1 Tax=Microbacterium alkaliflavum TaxID=3248839 RepID=A0ABW7Q775_9MICO
MTASLPVPQDAFPEDRDGATGEASPGRVVPLAKKAPRKPRRPRKPAPPVDPGPPPPLPVDLIAPPKPPLPPADVDIPPKPPLPVVEPEAEQVAAPEAEAEPGVAPEPAPEPEPEAAAAPAPEPAPAALEPEPRPESVPVPAAVLVAEPEAPPAPAQPAESAIEFGESPVDPDDADPFAASVVLDEARLASDADAALVLRGVVKRFGATRAVDGIDLTVPAGTFYGLVGPNGAGKTTTLSLIAGLLRPDKGSIRVGGVDAASDRRAAKRQMGVLPDRLRTFDRLTGRQLLYYYGVLRGLRSSIVESRIADLARAFDLTDALGRAVSDYSAGMLKKVMLAGALIHSPRLLVLDEPFEAVDPVSSAVILDILSAYVAHGGTVILSSHGMEFVERVCTRVAVLVAGQVLAEGTVDEVRGELTLEQRFIQLAGGLSDVEGLEWLHTFSD